jgi:hypothetical protein
MIGSACLCGEVRWQVGGELQFMSHCHCSRCRKAHGTAFATAAAVPESSFRLEGRERVKRWRSPAGTVRCFCGRCGSVVPGEPWEKLMFVPCGNLESDPGTRPAFHIFTGSKAPWYEITDSLPQYEAYPEVFDLPALPDRKPVDPSDKIRGSCLCGAVGFVVEGPILRCRYCHCSRCRRAHSAAHATNMGTAANGVHFTRGAEGLSAYKVPGSERFVQVFCSTCGGKVPRVDRARDMAVIPMGALDDDPGVRAQCHIFVPSKAPWFEITDSLPQFDGYPPQ